MTRRAIVAGAGIGGAVTARVLADRFDEVVVVERDALPTAPSARAGTPQDVHPHQLLTAARLELERLFPGFTYEAIGLGARFTCITYTHKIWGRLGWRPRYDSSLHALVMTRHLIDWMVRHRLAGIPNVKVISNRRAVGLIADASGTTVTGLCTRDPTSGVETELVGDLVVDSTGRSSQTPAWLAELGYPQPAEQSVNAFWGYASCFVQVPEDYHPEFEGIAGSPRGAADVGPLKTRAGGAFLVDGERRWILSAVGIAKDHPPKGEDEFRAFIQGLGVRELSELVDVSRLLTPPQAWRSTANRFRRYEQLATRPESFVVLGDAVASLNPIYGQGMSLATWAARDLGVELDHQRDIDSNGGLTGLAERFQTRLAASLEVPWKLSTRYDSMIDGAKLNFKLTDVVDTEFMRRLEALAMIDTDIALKMTETGHLVRPPDWMADPALRERIQRDWDELGVVAPQPVA